MRPPGKARRMQLTAPLPSLLAERWSGEAVPTSPFTSEKSIVALEPNRRSQGGIRTGTSRSRPGLLVRHGVGHPWSRMVSIGSDNGCGDEVPAYMLYCSV